MTGKFVSSDNLNFANFSKNMGFVSLVNDASLFILKIIISIKEKIKIF